MNGGERMNKKFRNEIINIGRKNWRFWQPFREQFAINLLKIVFKYYKDWKLEQYC